MLDIYVDDAESQVFYPVGEAQIRRRVKAEERTDRKKRWTTKVKTGCATCR